MVGDWDEEVRVGPNVPQRFTGFSRERLAELKPGARIELGRAPVARLTNAAQAKNLQPGQRFGVQATWTNLTDAAWQHQQQPPVLGNPEAAEGLRTPLPRRMLTGRFTSQVLELAK
jgi:hypothetical protein